MVLYSERLILCTLNALSPVFSDINNNNLFLFCLKDMEKMLQYFCCVCVCVFFKFIFTALKKKIQVKALDITESVTWLPNQFRKHCYSKRQPLRGEIFKIFGKRGEPYMRGLSILWGTWKPLRNHVINLLKSEIWRQCLK